MITIYFLPLDLLRLEAKWTQMGNDALPPQPVLLSHLASLLHTQK